MQTRMTDSGILLSDVHVRWQQGDDAVWCPPPIEQKTEKLRPPAITGRTFPPMELADKIRDRFRITELERKVTELMAAMAELKAPRAQPTKTADPAIADVLAITSEMFPGKVEIELEHDLADPDEVMVVLNVSSDDDVESVIDKQIEWHRRVDALESRHSGQLRLNVSPAS